MNARTGQMRGPDGQTGMTIGPVGARIRSREPVRNTAGEPSFTRRQAHMTLVVYSLIALGWYESFFWGIAILQRTTRPIWRLPRHVVALMVGPVVPLVAVVRRIGVSRGPVAKGLLLRAALRSAVVGAGRLLDQNESGQRRGTRLVPVWSAQTQRDAATALALYLVRVRGEAGESD